MLRAVRIETNMPARDEKDLGLRLWASQATGGHSLVYLVDIQCKSRSSGAANFFLFFK